jgi:hypothetical protein
VSEGSLPRFHIVIDVITPHLDTHAREKNAGNAWNGEIVFFFFRACVLMLDIVILCDAVLDSNLRTVFYTIKTFCRKHPRIVIGICITLASICAWLLAPPITIAILHGLGFGPLGPAAGKRSILIKVICPCEFVSLSQSSNLETKKSTWLLTFIYLFR